MRKRVFLIFFILFAVTFSVNAQEDKDFFDVWEFTCNDVPEEYATGDLIITKKQKAIEVNVKYSNGVITNGESAKIEKGTLYYDMYTQDGGKINILLKIVKNKLEGLVTLNTGEEFKLVASRK